MNRITIPVLRRLSLCGVSLMLLLGAASPSLAQLVGGTSYPINGTQNPPTSFDTIGNAVAYMAANGVTGTGQVLLELSTGYVAETGPVTIPVITGTSATLGVTFRPASGYTALTATAGTASPNQFAILIRGNYITLDGRAGGAGTTRSWTIRCTGSGASGNGQSAVRVDNTSNTMTDVTVKYCVLEAEAANTTSAIFGIAGVAGNTLKNLIIENNLIRSTGVSSTTCRGKGIDIGGFSNVGNTGLIIRDNQINDFHQSAIRFNSGAGFPAAVITGNNIFHTAAVTQASTTEFAAFYYSATTSPNLTFSHNFIHDLQLTNGTTAANGIYFFNSNTSGGVNRVFNNRVQIGAGIAPTTFPIFGIRDNTVSSATINFEYNSVYIGGSPAAGSANSAAFRKEVSSALNIRNNIFFNARSNAGATGTHWAISINNQTNLASINYNDYFANGTGGVLGTTDGATSGNRTTLAAWKAAVPADLLSVSQNPNYVNPTSNPPNMHVDSAIATQLESGGLVISGINDDFETDIRFGSGGYGGSGTAPDIGADEFNGTPLDATAPAISYTLLGNNTSTTTRSFPNVGVTDASGVNGTAGTRPRVYYKKTTNANTWVDNTSGSNGWKFAEGNVSSTPFDFTIDYSRIFGGTVAAGDIIQYFVVAQDLATTPNVGINSGTFAVQPTSVALTAAAFPIGGTINSYNIVASIAGSFTVGSGGTYGTLKAAFDDINAKVVTGNITLTVLASGTTETASAVLNSVAYEGGTFTITVKPDPALVTATPTITGSIAGALVKLNGADNVVFDGSNSGTNSQDLTLTNTSTAAGAGVFWLASLGTASGATNNTIKNCILACGADPTTSANEQFGIYAGGTSLASGASSGGADNDSNTFQNNRITKTRFGIYVAGATANPNDNVQIVDNLIGPATMGTDRIGKGGIVVHHQNSCTISRNEVRNVGALSADAATATDRVGIGLGDFGWTPTATTITNSRVSRNRVHDIVEEKTFSSAGIIVAGTGSPSSNIVDNNMIYAVRANGTLGDQGVGLGISAGNGDQVVYNSISLSGDIDPGAASTATQSACGIRISSTTPTNLTLKDNITSVDASSNTGTLKHFTVVAPSTSYVWGTGGSNNNDYYPKAGNAQMVLGGIGTSIPYTEVTTIAAWRTQFTPNQDGASFSVEPPFTSATDLHLLTNVPTLLESGGTPIAGVTIDYDAETRNATTPDIGADEGAFMAVVGNDVRPSAFVDPTNGGAKVAGVAFSPQATFVNEGSLPQTDVPVRYRITGPNPSPTEIYNNTQTIPSLGVGGSASVTFTSLSIGTAGTYTMYAKSELATDQNTSNDEIVGTFDVLAPLAGTYNVGSAQAAPFNTLTGAINRLNQLGVSDSVVFVLTDALYSTSETFPITIQQYPGTDPSRTVTIKPTGALTAPVAITGTSGSAVLVLNGADYIVIDGSASGGTSRDLTITNTSTSTTTAVVWGQTAAGPNGATNNVIKNVNLVGSGNTQTLIGVGFGSSTISTTSNGTDNDGNQVRNCSVTKTQYGIYSGGASAANKNTGTVVTQNAINTVTPNNVTIGGILVRFEDGVQVTENSVGEINRASGSNFGISLGFQASTNLLLVTSGDEVSNGVVTRNKVATIVSPSATGFSATGIAVCQSAAGTTLIANNMVSGVTAPATPSDFTGGIYVLGGAGTTQIYFNSVSMTGTRGAATNPSIALAIGGSNPPVDIRDNILVNTQTSTGTGRSYAIGLAYSTYSNLISNYNDLFTSGTSAKFAVVGGLTNTPAGDRLTLAAWRTETGQDLSSISADPNFSGTNDLHVVNTGPTVSPVANAGVVIAGITVDFDGETGHRATTPDIGADEFATYALNVSVIGNGSVAKDPDQAQYNPGNIVELTATAAPGWVFTGWSGDATGNTNPLDVTMDADKNITATFLQPAFAIADVTVTEGDAGTVDAALVLTLNVAMDDTVWVDFATADSTATSANNDYESATGTIELLPGETSDTVHVTVNGDLTNEADEIFRVLLSNPVGAVFADSLGLGTITNDDDVPSLSIDDVSVTEGAAGQVDAVFTLTLSNRTAGSVTVIVSTEDVTAEAGTDYVALVADTVVFEPKSLTQQLIVKVNGDLLDELDETFRVLIDSAAGATVADSEGVGTILNDDSPSGIDVEPLPAVSFLGATAPNPVVDQATIHFGLAQGSSVRLRVYDLQGRLVRELASGQSEAGYKQVVWDGKNDQGHRVGSGIYFLRMAADKKTFHQRIVLMR